jgi:hypothetical protein
MLFFESNKISKELTLEKMLFFLRMKSFLVKLAYLKHEKRVCSILNATFSYRERPFLSAKVPKIDQCISYKFQRKMMNA